MWSSWDFHLMQIKVVQLNCDFSEVYNLVRFYGDFCGAKRHIPDTSMTTLPAKFQVPAPEHRGSRASLTQYVVVVGRTGP